jgi:hypothetical protein
MLFYVYNKQLLAKAKAVKLFLNTLMFNNLANNYTFTNLTEQVIKNNIYF